jgi:hypothetical protein
MVPGPVGHAVGAGVHCVRAHCITQNTLFGATLFLQMVLESVLLVLAPSI